MNETSMGQATLAVAVVVVMIFYTIYFSVW
jgi:hypothetical protein